MKWIKFKDKRPSPNKDILVIAYQKRYDSEDLTYGIANSAGITKDGNVVLTNNRFTYKILFWTEIPKSPKITVDLLEEQ